MNLYYLLVPAGVLLVLGALGLEGGGSGQGADWRQVEVQDVRSGESFTIAELEKPLLVETFAVWCPTCTNQQNEIRKLKQRSDVSSVSVNVDPNEDREKVLSHMDRHGFNWSYVIAPPEMTSSMIDQYGNSVAQPPQSPVILVCENSTRRLENGVKSAEKLEEEIRKGCSR